MRHEKSADVPRVLFFIGSMGGGGAERQVVDILKHLDRKAFSPYLYLHHRTGPLLDEVPEDVPVYSFWENFAGTLRSKIHFLLRTTTNARWKHLRRMIVEHRISLVYTRTHAAAVDAYAACRSLPVARVSVCDSDPFEDLCYFSNDLKSDRIKLTKAAYRSATQAVAVSEQTRQRLADFIGEGHRAPVAIANMIDLDRVHGLAMQPISDLPSDRVNLLTVGRIAPEKGHRDFLQALAMVVRQHGRRDLLWHILGVGPEERVLCSEAKRLSLEDNVAFQGFQKNPFPWYQRADLLCHPAKHEAFGLVFLEALACGLPVLASDSIGGVREVLGGGRYGEVVGVTSPECLADGLLRFLAETEQWRDKAFDGLEYVRKYFSTMHCMKIVESSFRQAMEEVRTASES